jgi:hypothetical protein
VTGPDPIGVVYGDVRFRGDKAPKDVDRILDDASDQGDDEMADIGDKWGDTLDKRLKSSTKDTGRGVARGITAGIDREGIRVTRESIDFDDGIGHRLVERATNSIEGALRDEQNSTAFRRIGSLFSDAIGAGFNVSGRSPLIAILVPLLGFIGELVVGAIQVVNGLVAVLTVIPNAIGAIILQVGVLFLAFKGLGTAIKNAFAATNAEELRKALEGLTPAAQDFVKTLLPLRALVNELSTIAQENFFDRMGRSLQRVVDALAPILRAGIGDIASGLGDVARGILNILANPAFQRFLSELIPATVDWLRSFNSAFQDFLLGLANFGSAVMPFFSWLGESLNQALAEFGTWLGNLSVDPEFIQWLEDMKTNLTDGAAALGAITRFVVEFVDALQDAGGNEALKDITAQFNELAKFLATDEGTKAMEGLLHVIQLLAYAFIFMVNDIILFLFLLEVTAEFVKVLFTQWLPSWLASFGHWWVDTFTGVLSFLGNFFTNTIPELFEGLRAWVNGWTGNFFNEVGAAFWGLVGNIGNAFTEIVHRLGEVAGNVRQWFSDRVQDARDFVESIRRNLGDAALQFLNVLYQAGRNVVSGLIEGIRSMFGPLANVVSQGMQIIRNFTPFSPAKEGPLSGSGDPLIAGQKIVERIATGMEMEMPALRGAASNVASSVLVGANAVQMNFYGQTPTQQQAAGIGAAAGSSLADVIAQRNTRLAIRSIGSAVTMA